MAESGGKHASVDLEVSEALRRGDPATALEILMEAYGDEIERFCLSLTQDPWSAEDASQMTFLKAFRKFDTFKKESSYRTWLYRIARNQCLDLLRRLGRYVKRFVHSDVPPEPDRPSDLPTQREKLIDREHQAALESCLGDLPRASREAVFLYYIEDHTYPEMEKITGVAAATLQARASRALPKLRKCLKKKGISL